MSNNSRKTYFKPEIEEEAIFVPQSSACTWMPQSVYLSHHSGEACGNDIAGTDGNAASCTRVGKQWWGHDHLSS